MFKKALMVGLFNYHNHTINQKDKEEEEEGQRRRRRGGGWSTGFNVTTFRKTNLSNRRQSTQHRPCKLVTKFALRCRV
jgi:hypothetical protein